jgi:nickel transport protein
MTYQTISRLTRLSAALAAWGSLGWAVPVLAHGVVLGYEPVSGVEIQARYDNGDPMAEAQVAVYAPDNPTEPWMQGTTDEQGNFTFTPDASQPGNWEVMIRQAGHGGIVTVPVEGAIAEAEGSPDPDHGEAPVAVAPATDSSENLSSVQQGIAIGAVIWGFIGTALFFSRGKG